MVGDMGFNPGRRRLCRDVVRGAAATGLMLSTAGCTLDSVFAGAPRVTRLTSARDFTPGPRMGWQLLVGVPTTSVLLNTTRIAFTTSDGSLSYFRAEWYDPLPAMVQTLLIESLENSGRITAVARDTSGLRADYIMMIDIRDFTADYGTSDPAQSAPVIHIGMRAKLVAMPRRVIEESAVFEVNEPATGPAFNDVIAAFDRAFHSVAAQITDWALQPGRRPG